MAKTILISGAFGFLGSHIMEYVLKNTDWGIIAIESFRHGGMVDRLDWGAGKYKNRLRIYTHDLTVPLSPVFTKELQNIDYMINCASFCHVDRSIEDPVPFVQNNINLTLTMLELARKLEPKKFIQISTDEVYGEGGGEEDSPYRPSSPYAASKAAQESLCYAWRRTYNLPITIINSSNMFGERQMPTAFIPTVLRKLLNHEKLQIHTKNGIIATRKYLYVENLVDAVVLFLNDSLESPDKIHVAGEEQNILGIAENIAKLSGRELDYELVDFSGVRPGGDSKYGLVDSAIRNYGWEPKISFEGGLIKTIKWFQKNRSWL